MVFRKRIKIKTQKRVRRNAVTEILHAIHQKAPRTGPFLLYFMEPNHSSYVIYRGKRVSQEPGEGNVALFMVGSYYDNVTKNRKTLQLAFAKIKK